MSGFLTDAWLASGYLIQDTFNWGGFNGITSDQSNIWVGGRGAIYQVPLGTNPATDCPWIAGACTATLVAGAENVTNMYMDGDGTAARMGAIESMGTDATPCGSPTTTTPFVQ